MHCHCDGGGLISGTDSSQASDPQTLDDMTKAQLLELAGEMGIEGVSSRMKKADIINAIEEA